MHKKEDEAAGCSKSLHHECLVCNFYLTTARTWSRTPTDGSRSFAARPKPHEPARWMEEKPSCAALRASQPSFAQVHFTQKLALHFLFQFFFGTMRTLKFNERIYNISLPLKITLFRDTYTGCPNKFLTTLGLFEKKKFRLFWDQFETIFGLMFNFGLIWNHFTQFINHFWAILWLLPRTCLNKFWTTFFTFLGYFEPL